MLCGAAIYDQKTQWQRIAELVRWAVPHVPECPSHPLAGMRWLVTSMFELCLWDTDPGSTKHLNCLCLLKLNTSQPISWNVKILFSIFLSFRGSIQYEWSCFFNNRDTRVISYCLTPIHFIKLIWKTCMLKISLHRKKLKYYIIHLFIYFYYFIAVQLQISMFTPHHSPLHPSQTSPPPSLASI